MGNGPTRRGVVRSMAGGVLIGVAARSRSAAAQQIGVDSAGLGLLRRDFEAAYGVGADEVGITVYRDVEVGVPGATMYVQYRGEVVEHIEARWSEATQVGGVDWGTAYQASMFLLPVDAQKREEYWMPVTPEGPIAMVAHGYESAQLAEAHRGLGRVLVVFQRRYVQQNAGSPIDVVVPAVTLTMQEVPQ